MSDRTGRPADRPAARPLPAAVGAPPHSGSRARPGRDPDESPPRRRRWALGSGDPRRSGRARADPAGGHHGGTRRVPDRPTPIPRTRAHARARPIRVPRPASPGAARAATSAAEGRSGPDGPKPARSHRSRVREPTDRTRRPPPPHRQPPTRGFPPTACAAHLAEPSDRRPSSGGALAPIARRRQANQESPQ